MARPTDLSPRINRSAPREDWQQSALLSGFIATFCLTVIITGAYLFADNVGDQNGGTINRWLYNLAHNVSTDRTTNAFYLALGINLAVGLVLALVYARLERTPVLSGWRKAWRGVAFALIPFLGSILILFPLLGIGLLGIGAHAGPLPVLGSLIAHLVYGFVLGGFYGDRIVDWDGASDHDRDAARLAHRGSAKGMAIGLPIGAVVGFLMTPLLDNVAGAVAIVLAYILLGGAFGLLIGSFMGMSDPISNDGSDS